MRPTLFPALAILAAGIFLSSRAGAAITLTIDTANETFTWSGSATSLSKPFVSELEIRMGVGNWIGGVVVDGTDALTVSGSGSSFVYLSPDFSAGDLVVNLATGSLYTRIGFAQYSGPEPDPGPYFASATVTGNNVAYSYAELSQPDKAFLGSLAGTELFFQDSQGGAGVFNFGPAAGSIVVIPEPSASLLFSAGLGLAASRRKRFRR